LLQNGYSEVFADISRREGVDFAVTRYSTQALAFPSV
jgi:hypothetical protein